MLVLLTACHLLAGAGAAGVVTVNPRQDRLWPAGLTDVRGSLKRLHELRLLDVREQTADTLTLAWGSVALQWLDEFVESFEPPQKPRGRLARLVSPDVPAPARSEALDEAEQALAAVRARLDAEAALSVTERTQTPASSLPPSGAADRAHARARRVGEPEPAVADAGDVDQDAAP